MGSVLGREQPEELAQLVRALTAKPDNLSSIPGTYLVKGETQLPRVVLSHTPAAALHIQQRKVNA